MTLISANSTFGTLRENLYQSDYINRKKGVIAYCTSPSYCQKIKIAKSYNNLHLFNLGRYKLALDKCNILPVNKSNLIIGQYSKTDLNGVCTVSALSSFTPSIDPCGSQPCNGCQQPADPVVLFPPEPNTYSFYELNIIDPFGQLFGKTQCGELNYTNYMVFNPPTNPLTLGTS